MVHYGGPTPKKHYCYSNSPWVKRLWQGRLLGWQKVPKAEREQRRTTDVYTDRSGKRRWEGNPRLRQSECFSQLLETCIAFCLSSQGVLCRIGFGSSGALRSISCGYLLNHPQKKQRECAIYPGLQTSRGLGNTVKTHHALNGLYLDAFLVSCPPREYPTTFGMKFVELWEQLVSEKYGNPELPPVTPPAAETFAQAEFGADEDSAWSEANLEDVVRYLRGGKNLSIPDEFRRVLPHRF